eukprot:XP_020393642.1 uncharacterized protein LOC109939738 [Zea mays]
MRISREATAHDAPKSAENPRPSPSSSLSSSSSPPSEQRPARSAAVAVRVAALAAQRLAVFRRDESFLPTSLSPSRRSSNPWPAIVSPDSLCAAFGLRGQQPRVLSSGEQEPPSPSVAAVAPSHSPAKHRPCAPWPSCALGALSPVPMPRSPSLRALAARPAPRHG